MARRKVVTEIGDNGNGPDRWHVNRGIPIVWIIGSIAIGLAQFAGFVWYASQFNARVEGVERGQVAAAVIADKLQASNAVQGERLTRLEEKVVAVQATANRIEALLTTVKPR